MSYRGRFAPSPTGGLHFGSLVAALASWARARREGGAWIVRMEDLDPAREVPGAAQAQLRTLQAFGMASDEPVVRQSQRGPVYEAALQRLRERGVAFECRCSRSDLADQGGIHRRCVAAPATRAPAIRARVPDLDIAFDDAVQGRQVQNLAREVGDFVLWRVEGHAAYQLAVVVDDAAQQITEVVRGCDLLDSSPRQRWLQRVLGLPETAYLHVPLALDAQGRKLSKSLASVPVDDDDPLPALQAAWAFLGQAPVAARSVDAFLRDAAQHFDARAIASMAARPV